MVFAYNILDLYLYADLRYSNGSLTTIRHDRRARAGVRSETYPPP